MARAIVAVLDSLGVGASPDAEKFGDVGSNTFGHMVEWCADGRADHRELRKGPLNIPNLAKLGFVRAAKEAAEAGVSAPIDFSSIEGADEPSATGRYGFAQELSFGKDTPSGHWEMAGVPCQFDWGYFTAKENTFPDALLNDLISQTGIPGYLGNCHASGTSIVEELGEDHVKTGKPILYTSADSVFQIAAHEEHFGLDRLYEVCDVARSLVDEYNIGRVIARPFVGTNAANFERTGNRRDYATPPPAPTILEKCAANGMKWSPSARYQIFLRTKGSLKKRKPMATRRSLRP